MNVMIDLCLVPIGVGISLSEYIAACQKILRSRGLKHQMHPCGTVVEGEWDAVFAAVRACHEEVHRLGAPRITSTIKAGTRTDRAQTGEDKIESVMSRL